MSLLDDLRHAAQALDIQFQPTANEIQGILGALVHYAEHGDQFLQAAEAGAEDVSKLLVPPEPEPVAPPAPASTPSAPATDDELRAQLADLQAQLDSRQATAQQTQVEHETGAAAEVPSHPLTGLFRKS